MVSKKEKMNGSDQQIYDAVVDVRERVIAIETLQAERHDQNREDMNSLGNLTRSVELHCQEIGKLKVHRAIHWAVIGAIAIALILKP